MIEEYKRKKKKCKDMYRRARDRFEAKASKTTSIKALFYVGKKEEKGKKRGIDCHSR